MSEFCRFKKLGYVVLNVKDLEASTRFYRDVVGLDLTHSDARESRFSCSSDEHNLILRSGAVPGLERICFEVESGLDLERIKAQLSGVNCSYEALDTDELESLGLGNAIRTRVPGSELTLELFSVASQRSEAYRPTVAQILRLGHLVVKTPAFAQAQEFFSNVLNFKTSDRIKSEDGGPHDVVFMRCFPNPYHHSFGLASASTPSLHHIAFMVGSIDDIGAAVNRLPKVGSKIVFGPGRHLASGSMFLYFLDPDGMTIEYTFGMEEFSEYGAREARKLAPTPETVDQWGGQPQPGYASTGAIVLA